MSCEGEVFDKSSEREQREGETEVKMRCLIKGAETLQEEKELTLVEDGDELV
jgi:hypothetical protein